MNQEVKTLWIAALRSGEYTQGRGRLREGNSRCCLGVLCDLHAKADMGSWDGEWYDKEYQILPRAVIEWAGVPDFNPDIEGTPLTVYNDGSSTDDIRPHTFAEIADLIELYL